MNLKEAATYGKFLNDMIFMAERYSTSSAYTRTVVEQHNRTKSNPDASDETLEVVPQDKLNIKSNDLVYLSKAMIEEKLALAMAIEKGKAKLTIDWKENDKKLSLDSAVAYNKQLRALTGTCDSLKTVKSDESKRNAYDYKLNVEGNQVAYQYEVVTKKEVDFDKKVVNDLSKSLKEKTNKISIMIDQAMNKDAIDFAPKYCVNDTFEEIVEAYTSK